MRGAELHEREEIVACCADYYALGCVGGGWGIRGGVGRIRRSTTLESVSVGDIGW